MRRKIGDITGKKFNNIIINKLIGQDKYRAYIYEYTCECGTIKTARKPDIVSGKVKSCGCHAKKLATKHGLSRTKIYRVWVNMIDRCYNKNHEAYKNYGGRDIDVFKPWIKDVSKFYNDVIELIGEPLKNQEFDRKNNNKGYYPDNIRWVTRSINVGNTRKAVLVRLRTGEEISLREYYETKKDAVVPYIAFSDRVKLGWKLSIALRTPLNPGKQYKNIKGRI